MCVSIRYLSILERCSDVNIFTCQYYHTTKEICSHFEIQKKIVQLNFIEYSKLGKPIRNLIEIISSFSGNMSATKGNFDDKSLAEQQIKQQQLYKLRVLLFGW